MARPVTLFTGQWADLPLTELAAKAGAWGFDGLELACWGDHFDVDAALADDAYCRAAPRAARAPRPERLDDRQPPRRARPSATRIDARHQGVVPPDVWGDGDPEGVRQRAAEKLKDTARAAARFGVTTVTGFTGSPIWHMLYSFPPNDFAEIERGYEEFAERFSPIIDVFDAEGVKFALEVHPTEIAYDFVTTRKTLDALDNREGFGINFDPWHFAHQFLDSAAFVTEFADRIYHVHVKDSIKRLDGRRSILGWHLNFGEEARGWDFVSPGHGDVDFEELFRALNRIGYQGPLSIEWEDSGMDRDWGAPDALAFVRATDFSPSTVAFDAAFERVVALGASRTAGDRRCARASPSPRAAGWRRRTARWMSRCWRRISAPVDARRDLLDQLRLQHLEDPAGERQQQLVAGRLGEDLVEALVGVVERRRPRLVLGGLVDRGLQRRRGLLGRVGRRQAGQRHLEEHARVQQLAERDGLGREHHRDRLGDVAAHALARRAGDEDAARAAAADADQVRGGEQPQALAQRRARDAELRRELLLGADPVARLQPFALEIAPDLERDLMARVDARGRETRARELGGGHRRPSYAQRKDQIISRSAATPPPMKPSAIVEQLAQRLVAARRARVGLHQRDRRGLAGDPGQRASRRAPPSSSANACGEHVGQRAHVAALERPQLGVAWRSPLTQAREVRPVRDPARTVRAGDVVLQRRPHRAPMRHDGEHFRARFALREPRRAGARSRRVRLEDDHFLAREVRRDRARGDLRGLARSPTASSPRSRRARTTRGRRG